MAGINTVERFDVKLDASEKVMTTQYNQRQWTIVPVGGVIYPHPGIPYTPDGLIVRPIHPTVVAVGCAQHSNA